jgi:PDZ domain
MTMLFQKITLTVLATLTVVSFNLLPAVAASPQKTLVIAPGEPNGPHFPLPKFGFASQTIYGYGERVTFVRWNSRAAKLGLEPGDVILSLNGIPLSYHGSWNDALRQAMLEGGFVRLRIRDVNSGHIAFRQTFVGGYGPPVEHYNTGYPVGPNTSHAVKPHSYDHHQNDNHVTLNDIVKLFDKKN